jgi:hypothetical protein
VGCSGKEPELLLVCNLGCPRLPSWVLLNVVSPAEAIQ